MMLGWIEQLLYRIFHAPCVFHMVTGLYCPGCGGTRAVKYLLHGQVLMSLRYHPIVLYGVLVAAAELVSWLAARRTRRQEFFLGHIEQFSYVGVAIAAVNWLVKNVYLIFLGVDLLSASL